MRHQLSPPAGQKERTRVQANNGTKLEVERALRLPFIAKFMLFLRYFNIIKLKYKKILTLKTILSQGLALDRCFIILKKFCF